MKGFTLIELIIYIAIISIILTFTFGYAWNVIYGGVKTASYREVQQNGRLAMEKIARVIRDGQDPNTVFTVTSNVLYENGTALTSDRVKVTNLVFTSYGDSYKTEMTVEYNNLENRPEYEASMDLETTTLPRQ